eukprot:12658104-Heterocapsa_arctica.AAC.1
MRGRGPQPFVAHGHAMQFRAVAALRNLVGEIKSAQNEATAHRAAQSAAPDTEPTPMGVETGRSIRQSQLRRRAPATSRTPA